MKFLTRGLVIVVIIVHMMFFLLEAFFWMVPEVYHILLDFLNNPVRTEYPIQAITLKGLFINQGFYNLFITCAGVEGLYLVYKRNYAVGYALILFLCFCGFGAGIVLALSTRGYILAFLQAVPAALAFLNIYPLYKKASAILT